MISRRSRQNSPLNDHKPIRLECTVLHCYTKTHCWDKKSFSLEAVLLTRKTKCNKKLYEMCKQQKLTQAKINMKSKSHSQTMHLFNLQSKLVTYDSGLHLRPIHRCNPSPGRTAIALVYTVHCCTGIGLDCKYFL